MLSWAPSWTATAHFDAKLDCPGALGRKIGMPRRSWTPFWAPTWRPSAPPERPGPAILLDSMALFTLFQKLPFVPSKCSWTAFRQLLGPFWAPFGLNLGPLGRLLGSTWGLWGAFGAHLGASWAPLGFHLGLLGASWANLGPSGRQMGSKWTPSGRKMDAKWTSFGRQVDAKLDCHNGCKFQRTP